MQRFRLDRVDLKARIASDYLDGGDAGWTGEETRWMANVPNVYRALAAPQGTHEFIRAPQRGDDHLLPGPAYWASLLHLLVYSFGWRYPREGLRWWTDNGRPTDDLRLALMEQAWVADGQFDWFCAWLWSGTQALGPGAGFLDAPASFGKVRPTEWFDAVESAISVSGAPSPYGGGTDPFHLYHHVDMSDVTADPSSLSLVLDADGGPGGVLLADSLAGWYPFLHEAPALASPHPSGRSWRIEVIVRPFGTLGVYRRSRVTGRWFAGPHHLHVVGNPA